MSDCDIIMPEAPRAANEEERLRSLRKMGILDTPREPRYDRITRLATRMFDVPIAQVTLVDDKRQWFKSVVGMEVSETPRTVSFCAHAILKDEVTVVEDATRDGRFLDNPLVTGEEHIRFYAGQPLFNNEGYKVGTLCIVDTKPRKMSVEDLVALRDLSKLAELEINERKSR